MLDFEKLFLENQSFVYRYLMKLCGNHSLAEELTQETFFRAYMNLTGLRNEEKGACHPAHTRNWDIDEDGLQTGVQVFVQFVLDHMDGVRGVKPRNA